MPHFIIYTNAYKDQGLEITKCICNLLEKGGAKVTALSTEADQQKLLPNMKADAVITLGGDGTILQAVKDMADNQMPVIGVNLGHLGFLTEVGQDRIEELVRILLSQEYTVDSRMMLDGYFTTEGISKTKTALNDIVISRCGSLQILCFQVYVNGQFFHEYLADGIICSTPTGSTGYNLSAGGPLIEPNARIITLTPICPHSLNQRSILLSASDEIEFRIPLSKDGKKQMIEASFDGQDKILLESGDSLLVAKSQRHTDMIRVNQTNFLEILNRKFGENL